MAMSGYDWEEETCAVVTKEKSNTVYMDEGACLVGGRDESFRARKKCRDSDVITVH